MSFLLYVIILYVAEDLNSIDSEMSQVIGAAWSKNTLASRNSQWTRFFKFCHTYELTPLPASPETVARFLVWQSRSSKYSTCNNYLSAINVLHRYYGYELDFRESFLIKLVLKGLKSTLGDQSSQMRPFTVEELSKMFERLDMSSEREMVLWTIVIFSFRTSLRKSNLIPTSLADTDHVVRRRDISFHSWGMLVCVRSTKTLSKGDHALEIPVHYVNNPVFCAASAVKFHLSTHPADDSDLLFYGASGSSFTPILYPEVLGFIKLCASRIGLKPSEVGCHSLRRSGAAHMHRIRVPLEDIMCIGDWKSMAVLDYLVTTRDRKDVIQRIVAASFSL